MVDPAGHQLLTSSDDVEALVARVAASESYTIDTEFHRERTYFPQLALVQVELDGEIFLIDPIATDPRLMRPMFESDSLAILHAARQDLEVLAHASGAPPRRVYDTQVAAGFLGYSSPSLSALLEGELGVKAPKVDRLTDWLHRPLTDRQLLYAAADVAYLREIYNIQIATLAENGRTGWYEEAIAEMVDEYRGPREPTEAWRRIKEARHLRGADLAVAQALAAWRERRAQQLDLTPRYVMADLAIVGLAASRPTSLEQAKKIRGVDQRSIKSVADELFAVIADAADNQPDRDRPNRNNELPPSLRPAVPLVTAWVAQLSRMLKIDSAILATRNDLEAFLRKDPESRLARGWRLSLVGEPLGRLVNGEVSLAFDPKGGLIIEQRSHQPIEATE